MREKLNCPNCGAVINSVICPYCGSVFYDFANIDTDKPSYLRMKIRDKLYVFKAKVSDLTVHIDTNDASLYANGGGPIICMQSPSYSISIDMDIIEDDRGVLLEKYESMHS